MAGDLQTVYSVSLPSGGFDMHMLLILAIMVVTGILGGIANGFLADRQGAPAGSDWIRYPLLGVVAALTVPLFLNMLASTLLEGARTKPVDFFVFAGFCLIYVVASRRLFENIVQRLLGQLDQVRREVSQLQQQRDESPVVPLRAEPELSKATESDPREVLSYNDIEILRALAGQSFVYGNLAAVCDATGLPRELVSQRLTMLKSLGVIETRINDRNVLHWFVSQRGKTVLDEILGGQEEKKIA